MTMISTIIPAFNRAALIGATLQSVLSQTQPPNEIIVVDDGSTDDTVDVVRSFGRDVRLISQPNAGAGAARNCGLEAATGDYVHFMDSDDLISLNTYKCHTDIVRAAQSDIVYGPWVKTVITNQECRTQPVAIQQYPLPSTPSFREWVLRGWVTVFQPCLFRTEMIRSLGGYRVDLKPTEDSELLYRIGRCSAKVSHSSETLVLYRVHPQGQVSVVNEDQRRADWWRFLSVMDKHGTTDGTCCRTTRRYFDFLKLAAAANSPKGTLTEMHTELLAAVPVRHRVAYKLSMLPGRLVSKLRRARFGDNYPPVYGLAAIGAPHLHLIRKMGYIHRGFYKFA